MRPISLWQNSTFFLAPDLLSTIRMETVSAPIEINRDSKEYIESQRKELTKRFVDQTKAFIEAVANYAKKELEERVPFWQRSGVLLAFAVLFFIFAIGCSAFMGWNLMVAKGVRPFQAAAWLSGGFFSLTMLFFASFFALQSSEKKRRDKSMDSSMNEDVRSIEKSGSELVEVARDLSQDLSMVAKQAFSPKEIIRKSSPQIALGALLSGFLVGVITVKNKQ